MKIFTILNNNLDLKITTIKIKNKIMPMIKYGGIIKGKAKNHKKSSSSNIKTVIMHSIFQIGRNSWYKDNSSHRHRYPVITTPKPTNNLLRLKTLKIWSLEPETHRSCNCWLKLMRSMILKLIKRIKENKKNNLKSQGIKLWKRTNS